MTHRLHKQSLGGVARHARGERGGATPPLLLLTYGGVAGSYTSSTDIQSSPRASERLGSLIRFVFLAHETNKQT